MYTMYKLLEAVERMNSTQTTAKKNKIQWNHVSELKNKASISKFETK